MTSKKKSIAIKATLLSAFIFPGAGHWYLQCRVRAGFFIIIAGLGLYLLISSVFSIALSIAEQIASGAIENNIGIVYGLVQDALNTLYGTKDIGIAKILIISAWIISTIDAYRVGAIRDRVLLDDEA